MINYIHLYQSDDKMTEFNYWLVYILIIKDSPKLKLLFISFDFNNIFLTMINDNKQVGRLIKILIFKE